MIIKYGSKIEFGSNTKISNGYLGVDIDINVKTDYHFDVFKLIPIQDNYISAIKASHILEHAESNKTIDILKEWNRILIPNGVLEIYVPNLTFASIMIIINRIMNNPIIPENAIFGNHYNDYFIHKTGFTAPKLKYVLQKSGFRNIQIKNGRKKLHSGYSIGGILNRIIRSELYAKCIK